MDRCQSALQIQLTVKKPYQGKTSRTMATFYLICINQFFLSLFCLRHGFYSARHCNRGSIEHEHNYYQSGL